MEAYRPKLSLVIPLYNEQGNIKKLLEEIETAMRDYPNDWEVVIVDDGSTDGSNTELNQSAIGRQWLRVIRLSKNFGQTAAISAGVDHATGEVIITLDADLQNDPADIPTLLDEMGKGYDVVSGWRYKRKDNFLLRSLPSIMANYIISLVTGVHLHDYGCTLKAYRQEVIKDIRIYGKLHRFLPALCSWRGASVGEVRVNHRPRTVGHSKYGLNKTFGVILDLITVKFLLDYSQAPMRFFGSLGALMGIAGAGAMVHLLWVKYGLGEAIGDRPLLIIAVLLIIVGIQLLVLGLLTELCVRIYYEAQGKSSYRITKVINNVSELREG